jgi:hypothetical protein
MAQAILAYVPAAKKGSRRAQQQIVVQGLNNRNIGIKTCVIGGWRNQWQGIVKMSQVGLLLFQEYG